MVSGPPSQGAVQVLAAGYVLAWLRRDFWTCARIADGVESSGASAGQVAEVFSLFAASLLTEVLGSSAAAGRAADRRAAVEVSREARLLSAAS